MKLLTIIPCHNIAKSFQPEEFDRIANSDHQFIFANNGSTDNTKVLIESLTKKNPNCLLFNSAFELNKGELLRKTYFFARGEGLTDCDYIAFWSATLDAPLDEINQMTRMASSMDVDCITGSRLKNDIGWLKKIQLLKLHFILAFFFGLKFEDCLSPFKLFKASRIDRIVEASFYTHLFPIESILRASLIRTAEYQLKNFKGKIKFLNPLSVLFDLITLKRKY